MTERGLVRTMARVLERDVGSFTPFSARTLIREIELPREARVIGVGGATLGGSGKTPLAIAIVRALVERNERVAFVAHGYGARTERARIVLGDDDPRDVGDESIVAARALRGVAPVVVGPDRTGALRLAAKNARVLVVDHLHQTRPRPLEQAVLSIDDCEPWGSRRTFPFGDLVARPESLLAIADVVVRVGGADARHVVEVGSTRDRVGLITSVARPHRILRTLRAFGIDPVVHVERADHAPARGAELRRIAALSIRHAIDRWLVDDKSSVWIGRTPRADAFGAAGAGAPIASLAHRLELAPSIVDRIARGC